MRQLSSSPKIQAMHARHRRSSRACLALAIASVMLWLPVRAQQNPPAAPAPKAGETGPHPQAVVVQPVIDLGEVTYGESRTLEFAIKNTGDDVLRIHAAKSQCACAVIEFTPEVAPGAEGKIAVRFDAALSGGPTIPRARSCSSPSRPTSATSSMRSRATCATSWSRTSRPTAR
jgi:hypothetical protein